MSRQARLFALAEVLRGRRHGVTADALAERFGVTVRTIYRDLDELRDAGFPLTAERGRGGGYALDRAYSLPPVNFTPKQAAVLIALGRWARELRFLPFVDTLEAALDKVRGALTAAGQRELVAQVDALCFVGIPALPTAPGVRAALETAWLEHRALAIRYHDGDGVPSERVVSIERLVMERSHTWLDAFDHLRGAPRRFRLDRVSDARVVDPPETAR